MRNVTETNDSISSKGEHFRVMMDVFIVWQTTLTTDGDYTSYFLLFTSYFCLTSAVVLQAATKSNYEN